MIVGILGGIGAGKSTVTRLFSEEGAETVDADALAHEALEAAEVKEALVKRLGEKALHTDGTVDRKVVAAHVFGRPQDLRALESLVHPGVVRRIGERIAAYRARPEPRGLLVLDVPLLAASPLRHECDEMVFVEADEGTRSQRVEGRGWEPEELERREQLQSSLLEKRRMARHVIHNSTTIEAARAQVRGLLASWGNPERRK